MIHVVYLVAQNHYRVNGKLKPKCAPWKWSFGGKSLKVLNKACPTLIWWEVLNGFIRHEFGTWGVPQGVPKCFRGRGYGQNGLDPLDPKITTHARAPPLPSVRSVGRAGLGLGLGAGAWCEVGLGLFGPILIFLGQKHLNLIQINWFGFFVHPNRALPVFKQN